MKTDFLTSRYDTGQSYRAMAFVARVSTLGMIVLGMLCIALVCLVIKLFPLKENRPYLLVLSVLAARLREVKNWMR